MVLSSWSKVDFQQFVKDFGIEVVIENAPIILYSKKDKEHEASNSLIAFFFVTSGLLIYISLSLFLIEIYFSIIVFITVISLAISVDVVLILNYRQSNIFIRPTECWIEIYKNHEFFCFSYYVIFTGKSLSHTDRQAMSKVLNRIDSKIASAANTYLDNPTEWLQQFKTAKTSYSQMKSLESNVLFKFFKRMSN